MRGLVGAGTDRGPEKVVEIGKRASIPAVIGQIESIAIEIRRGPNGLFEYTRTINGEFNGGASLYGSALDVLEICVRFNDDNRARQSEGPADA